MLLVPRLTTTFWLTASPRFFKVSGLVKSLDGGFDDLDESFVALASASSNSATLAISFAICSDCLATSF